MKKNYFGLTPSITSLDLSKNRNTITNFQHKKSPYFKIYGIQYGGAEGEKSV